MRFYNKKYIGCCRSARVRAASSRRRTPPASEWPDRAHYGLVPGLPNGTTFFRATTNSLRMECIPCFTFRRQGVIREPVFRQHVRCVGNGRRLLRPYRAAGRSLSTGVGRDARWHLRFTHHDGRGSALAVVEWRWSLACGRVPQGGGREPVASGGP